MQMPGLRLQPGSTHLCQVAAVDDAEAGGWR